MTILEFLDYLAIAVFAATGALSASRKQLDLIGFIFLAAAAGIGGGTFRDLILGQLPVFWVRNPNYLLVCIAAAIILYFTAHLFESRYRLLLWLDAVGIAVYAVVGAHKGLVVTGSPLVAILTGAMTGTLGGILRDVLTGAPNAVTRKEIYVTAAVLGAASYVGLYELGFPGLPGAAVGALVAFGVRAGALLFGWTLPAYRSREGRPTDP